MVSSTFHKIQNVFSNWNVLYAVLSEKQIYWSRIFNDKNRLIIRKVMVLKKLLPHLATRGTYTPGDWRCDEAWREQTFVYPPVMCQQRLVYCTWELNVMTIGKRKWDPGGIVHRKVWGNYRWLGSPADLCRPAVESLTALNLRRNDTVWKYYNRQQENSLFRWASLFSEKSPASQYHWHSHTV